jgi:hypothetical protein
MMTSPPLISATKQVFSRGRRTQSALESRVGWAFGWCWSPCAWIASNASYRCILGPLSSLTQDSTLPIYDHAPARTSPHHLLTSQSSASFAGSAPSAATLTSLPRRGIVSNAAVCERGRGVQVS